MDIFDTLFTLFMILFPAVFTLFIKVKTTRHEQPELRRKLTIALWVATGLTAAVYLLLAQWQPAVAFFMWFAFFPLWFLLAMPLLRIRDPGWGPVTRGAQRSASLIRRDVVPPELRFGWIAITALWGLLLCASIMGLVLEVSRPAHWWLLGFNLAAGFELWLLHWAMGRSLIEPEPVAADETDMISEERERFRRFKLLGWLILATLMMLIFSLPSLLLIWYGNEALVWAIVIGAGGGSLVGIGGGVFGTIASIKRARINRLSIEASPGD